MFNLPITVKIYDSLGLIWGTKIFVGAHTQNYWKLALKNVYMKEKNLVHIYYPVQRHDWTKAPNIYDMASKNTQNRLAIPILLMNKYKHRNQLGDCKVKSTTYRILYSCFTIVCSWRIVLLLLFFHRVTKGRPLSLRQANNKQSTHTDHRSEHAERQSRLPPGRDHYRPEDAAEHHRLPDHGQRRVPHARGEQLKRVN